ncbi:MAG: hypothetical protein IKS07_04260 [Lachnospiraceae bacterium]|nr:hypothetical protein [Lachnospiraceae bacterium]
MKKQILKLTGALLVLCLAATGCGSTPQSGQPEEMTFDDEGEPFAEGEDERDFSALRTPGSQEAAYAYRSFFLPAVCGISQPYVGDVMPYYEDGVYYLYYLKDGGDSYNHSVFLTKTTDFVTYEEAEGPVLEADRSGGQDAWIGTGSVVKAGGKYLFFYTGHGSHTDCEYAEKIRVAAGSSLTSFEKVEGFEITPPGELNQKNDFRDPQAYYDPEEDRIILTVTASKDNVARVLKYSVSPDLETVTYEGILYDDPTGEFWNLECTDTFRMGERYYLTYSAQDDTLWYAVSDTPEGPYLNARRMDGPLFYAAKHVEGPEGPYMVGWARRSESPSSTSEVSAWGGNLVAMKLCAKDDGDLYLAPVPGLREQFAKRRKPLLAQDDVTVSAGSRYAYTEYFTCREAYMLTGKFSYTGSGSFGLAFDYNGDPAKYKLISIDPAGQSLDLLFNEGTTPIASAQAALREGEMYSFTYIQEGSVGTFFIDGETSLTVRIYGVTGKSIRLFAGNNTVLFTDLREYTR